MTPRPDRRDAAASDEAGVGSPVSLTVLVVEDDAEMRALLRDLLERDGYRVVDRPSGQGLMPLLETEAIDAVILDREMPGASGLDLLSILRRRLPDVPVVLITSFGGPVMAEEAQRRGAYRYLEKPFRLRTVLDALRDGTRAPVPRAAAKTALARETTKTPREDVS